MGKVALSTALLLMIVAVIALYYQGAGETAVLAEQLGQRSAILTIGMFLLVGLLLLTKVNEVHGRALSRVASQA